MVGDTGDDVDEDLIGIDENVITMDKSGDSDEALGVLATSKSGTLLLRRDQGDVAALLDSLSRWL